MKKLSLLLAVLMLASAFVACAGDGGETETTTAAPLSTTAPDIAATTAAPVEEGPADPLPADLKFEGETVRFMSRDLEWMADEVSVEEINGEVVNDAIFKRQQSLEERLGIKTTNFKTGGSDQYAITNQLKNLVLSQSDEYDLVYNSSYSTIMYTGDNLFHNLYELEHLNLENEWWSQGFNEQASIGNAQYMCTGDISLSLKRMTFVTFFNQQLFKDFEIPDIYQTVRDGKWTLEYQGQIALGMYRDLNGDQNKDVEDAYGFMLNADQMGVDCYWSALDLRILSKTPENTYTYGVDIDRLARALEALNKLVWENEGVWHASKWGTDAGQDSIAQRFASGNVGMVNLRLVESEEVHLRDMKDTYGIIPIPKLDEQDEYFSYAHDQFNGLVVPLTVLPDRYALVGATLEEMAYLSKKLVMPAYYEVAMKTKYASDVESGEMLDLIFAQARIDAGVLYTKNINSVHQTLRTLVGGNNSNVASQFKAYERLVPKQLDKMQEKILDLQK